MRFVPIIPFWITNLASALFGVPLRTFALATLIGIIPAPTPSRSPAPASTASSRAQHEAPQACLAAGRSRLPASISSLKTLVTPKIIAAFGRSGLLALLPVVLRRFFGDRFKWLGGGNRTAREAGGVTR